MHICSLGDTCGQIFRTRFAATELELSGRGGALEIHGDSTSNVPGMGCSYVANSHYSLPVVQLS